MCKFNRIYRYESHRALKHPWVTRSAKSSIPLTMLESYSKQDLIKKFKLLLGTVVFLPLYKAINPALFLNKVEISNSMGENTASERDKSNVDEQSADDR